MARGGTVLAEQQHAPFILIRCTQGGDIMRRIMSLFRLGIVVAILAIGAASAPPAHAAVSFDLFYSSLSPHGSWLVSGQYGRVWQPAVYAPGWNPYSDGHWVYTDLGWTWVSDYEWGAVPYHYGTWASDPELGWVWVPGYVWAPSWVVFRTGPDYIGWAPVSPGFSVGVSFGFSEPVAASFTFVSCHDFLAPRIGPRIVSYSQTRGIINNTRVVNSLTVQNNIVVNRGPDVSVIGRATGRRIEPVPIERVSRVAPGRRFSRDQIGVDAGRSGHGLRAAEPVSERTPLPAARHGAGDERARGAVAPHPHGASSRPDSRHRVKKSDLQAEKRVPVTREARVGGASSIHRASRTTAARREPTGRRVGGAEGRGRISRRPNVRNAKRHQPTGGSRAR
jgi:hypothetical protein